jgi:GDP-L-fucose synthase
VVEAMKQSDTIYVAGHRGLAGSAIWRGLETQGFSNLVGFRSTELDLTDRSKVFDTITNIRPDVIIDAAAKVGGIHANSTYPADFLSQNLQIQTNLMDAANAADVPRLLFLGSSCIYPKFAAQPIAESSLLTGPLEETNDAYAIAKIAGVLQVQAMRTQHARAWFSAMPTNLYGPGDNFHPENSHVLAALLRRFHEARIAGDSEVAIWGTGTPLREFLFVDDLADAVIFLLNNYDDPRPINIGSGHEVSISTLAAMIADVVGFEGTITHDTSKPDGTPRKILDSSRLSALGWDAATGLEEGLRSTYRWFVANIASLRQA